MTFDGPIDEEFWASVRSHLLLDETITFLNTGTAGPAWREVLEARERIDREIAVNPYDPYRVRAVAAVRRKAAAFLNADASEVFFTHSTTEGMNIFANGIDWNQGDEVLIAKHEHFGGYEVYKTLEKRRGIRIVWVDLPSPPLNSDQIIEIYSQAFTANTRLVVASHVLYTTGLLLPIEKLAALAHQRGALISVDGAQAVGVLPLDLRQLDVDHYAAPGQKWLLAAPGTGFMYVRESLQGVVWPHQGFDEIGAPSAYPLARYEKSGQWNTSAWLGIEPAIAAQVAIGRENIERRARDLSNRLRVGLAQMPALTLHTSREPGLSASLTTFSVSGITPQDLVRSLIDKDRIYTRTILMDDLQAVRVSTHIYNTPAQIDQLLAAIRREVTVLRP